MLRAMFCSSVNGLWELFLKELKSAGKSDVFGNVAAMLAGRAVLRLCMGLWHLVGLQAIMGSEVLVALNNQKKEH